jgi:hypothetical protein
MPRTYRAVNTPSAVKKAGRSGLHRKNFDVYPETRRKDINILWEGM